VIPRLERLTHNIPGTVITNHFLVLDKTRLILTFGGCPGTKQSPLTPNEPNSIFELCAAVNEKRQQVESRLKSITFDGIDPTGREDPYGGFPGLLHRQDAKLLVEAAVSHCAR
jgi:hypothetical protein